MSPAATIGANAGAGGSSRKPLASAWDASSERTSRARAGSSSAVLRRRSSRAADSRARSSRKRARTRSQVRGSAPGGALTPGGWAGASPKPSAVPMKPQEPTDPARPTPARSGRALAGSGAQPVQHGGRGERGEERRHRGEGRARDERERVARLEPADGEAVDRRGGREPEGAERDAPRRMERRLGRRPAAPGMLERDVRPRPTRAHQPGREAPEPDLGRGSGVELGEHDAGDEIERAGDQRRRDP